MKNSSKIKILYNITKIYLLSKVFSLKKNIRLLAKKFFHMYTEHPKALNSNSNTLIILAFVPLIFLFFPFFATSTVIENYLPLHIFLEIIPIIIAMQIAGIGWHTYSNNLSLNTLFLALLFLGVAFLDFTHLLSYPGMPYFMTPNTPDKSIYFWLAARLVAAVGLLIFVISPLPSLRLKNAKYILLSCVLAIVTLLHWPLFIHEEWLSQTFFVPAYGLTTLKISLEYSIIFLNILTALFLYKRTHKTQSYNVAALIMALCMMAISEFFFTLYADVADIYNVLGHLYKALAYFFIYRAIFVSSVQEPYQKLDESKKQIHESEQWLHNIIDNIPHMVFVKNASDLRYALFNKAGEKLTGLKREELLGRNDYDFFPKEQADFFAAKDMQTLKFESVIDILEEEIQTPQGTRILHTKKLTLKDTHGHSQYLLGISEDITERKKIETALHESKHFLHESQFIAGLGSYVLDLRSGLWTSSDVLDTLLGIDETYLRSVEGWSALIHPDDRERMELYFQNEVLAKSIQFNQEYKIIRANDQAPRWMHGVGKLEFDSDGVAVRMIGTIQDITEQKSASHALLKLSQAVEQSPNSIVITDLNGNIEYVNTMFTTVTGYASNEVLGKNPNLLKSNQTPQATYDDMWAVLTSGKTWHGELINSRKDGSIYIESAIISPVKQPDGKTTNYVAVKEDITAKKKAEARMEQLAHFDQLTGLPNRVMLNDRVKYLLNISKRSNEPLAVMFLDLDHFKNINDTLGHSIGDKILIEMAQRLTKSIRSEDTVSRLGGDEFIMLFPNTDSKSAMHIATKLIEAVSQASLIENHELTITPSIGIAIYPNDGQDFETLLKNADTAMYKVKNNTRNSFNFFTQEMQSNLARNLQLVNALRHALKRSELEVYYQPQISIQDGYIIGAEALLRWNHPELGMISPAEFIPIAEDSGQIIEIGEWVLRTATAQMKKWLTEGSKEMIMAVNLSAVQFRQPNFTTLVTTILEETQLAHQHLELELTEAVTMSNPKAAIDIMNILHEQGIRMSIDDFGTGYSSLSYLKQFKVYKLKIDQSFIRNITDDSEDRAIVSAIIDMANNLGLRTIAEGVETSEQLAFLRLHGCHEVQGYYFSKPLTSEKFSEFLKNNTTSIA
jgi:diguanylate cyclase (GGDEF)-like protein/PAS domain S-box-containing protein